MLRFADVVCPAQVDYRPLCSFAFGDFAYLRSSECKVFCPDESEGQITVVANKEVAIAVIKSAELDAHLHLGKTDTIVASIKSVGLWCPDGYPQMFSVQEQGLWVGEREASGLAPLSSPSTTQVRWEGEYLDIAKPFNPRVIHVQPFVWDLQRREHFFGYTYEGESTDALGLAKVSGADAGPYLAIRKQYVEHPEYELLYFGYRSLGEIKGWWINHPYWFGPFRITKESPADTRFSPKRAQVDDSRPSLIA